MKFQLAFTTVLAIATATAASSSAQTAQSDATQTARLQTERLQSAQLAQPVSSGLVLQQRDEINRRARPERPRIMPINWTQVQVDLRQQSAFVTGELTTATRLVQRFPRPANEEASQAANSNLPVLLPSLEALDLGASPRALLFPRENFYTFSVRGPRILIEVFGTRLAHTEAPDPASLRRLLARGPSGFDITRTEYGVEVNFSRYGAAYTVTVECDNPETDPRCTQPDYARRIAETLVIAAGSPAEGE